MPKFPIDAPIERVIRALQILGFTLVREGNHIAMQHTNADGTTTPDGHPCPSLLPQTSVRGISARRQSGVASTVSNRASVTQLLPCHIVTVSPSHLRDFLVQHPPRPAGIRVVIARYVTVRASTGHSGDRRYTYRSTPNPPLGAHRASRIALSATQRPSAPTPHRPQTPSAEGRTPPRREGGSPRRT